MKNVLNQKRKGSKGADESLGGWVKTHGIIEELKKEGREVIELGL